MQILLAAVVALWLGSRATEAAAPPAQRIDLKFEYLEACETGQGECRPVVINRRKGEQVSVAFPLIYRASVSLWDSVRYEQHLAKQGIKPLEVKGSGDDIDNPASISFDLTKRADGTYRLWLASCGVGGVYEVRLKTR